MSKISNGIPKNIFIVLFIAEQHCRSTASLVSSLRDRMVTYCSQCLTPGSVSEIVYGKVDILEVSDYSYSCLGACAV